MKHFLSCYDVQFVRYFRHASGSELRVYNYNFEFTFSLMTEFVKLLAASELFMLLFSFLSPLQNYDSLIMNSPKRKVANEIVHLCSLRSEKIGKWKILFITNTEVQVLLMIYNILLSTKLIFYNHKGKFKIKRKISCFFMLLESQARQKKLAH